MGKGTGEDQGRLFQLGCQRSQVKVELGGVFGCRPNRLRLTVECGDDARNRRVVIGSGSAGCMERETL
jgi:hypothetical protein